MNEILRGRIIFIPLFALILIVSHLSLSITFAFSPPPPDEGKMRLCRLTGGEAVAISYSPDCGPGCDAAWRTVVYCKCSDGTIWKDIEHIKGWIGCATNKTGRNAAHIISWEQFKDELKLTGKWKNVSSDVDTARIDGSSTGSWFSRFNSGFVAYVILIAFSAVLIGRRWH